MNQHIARITERLYLGDIFSIREPFLDSNITTIISLINCPNISQHLKHLQLPIEDDINQNILDISQKIYEYIECNPLEICLIHCSAGKSRSASVIIYYLMKKYNLSYLQSHQLVASKKEIGLNSGFVQQLQTL